MPLRRATRQAGRTLREYYEDLANLSVDNPLSGVGAAMLELLPRIERECADRDVFGVTSNEALHLHATDDAAEQAPVIVRAITDNEVRVAYRLPSTEAPWPDALVQGIASSPEAAARMVKIAMQRSSAWKAQASGGV